jgi:hypothetical protein
MVDPFDALPNCGTPAPAELYDPAMGRFSAAVGMRPMAPAMPVLVPDGRVLLLGGSREDCTPLGLVEAFDLDLGTASVLASGVLPETVLDAAIGLDDGSILILSDKGVDVLTLE